MLNIAIDTFNLCKELLSIEPMIMDARFAKPLDQDTLRFVRDKCDYIIVIEEGSRGGFAAAVLNFFAEIHLLDGLQFKAMTFPDCFLAHATREEMYAEAGLTAHNVLNEIKSLLELTLQN